MTDDRDRANAPAEKAAPAFRAWTAGHNLQYEQWWSLPQATQILRHGMMQEVRSLAWGAIDGIDKDVRVAHADYAWEGGGGLHARWLTVVLIAAPASVSFANRILCHDRGLTDMDRSNPDAERKVIELDDQAVRLESDAFLQRYTLSADHDQDQMRIWELLDPEMVDWLTTGAPDGFSFELQDGALCCFVPALLTEEAALDGMVAAAGRVFARVSEVTAGSSAGPAAPPAPGTRAAIVEGELAEHKFDAPPDNVRRAARAFRKGPLLGERAWKLGAEAFFREYAATIGFSVLDPAAFRAQHLDLPIIGVLEQVAGGPLPGAGLPSFLALSNDDDMDDLGWATLVAPVQPGVNSYGFAGDPRVDAIKADGYDITSDGTMITIWLKDDGRRSRKRKNLDRFMARAAPLLGSLATGLQ